MVFQQVLILFIFVAIGYTLAKCRLVDRSHSKILSTLLVYVFSPCNVLSSFSRNFNRKYISENYVFILVGLAVVLLLAVGAFFASRLFSKDKYERKILYQTADIWDALWQRPFSALLDLSI